MLLRKIETKNFLSHEDESIALPAEGMFLLSGPSGSGKSSFIVDAMAYALFGVVATRARRQQDLRTRGSSEEMSVRATFDFPERRIIVARGLDERGSSWAQVYEDKDGQGVLLAEGSAPVQRFIRRELGGMTWQQFYAAFVARQSEIVMLTSLRGAERKALVQRMLGMRELEKTSEIISSQIRHCTAEATELEKSRGLGDVGALEEEIDELTVSDEEASGEKKTIQKTISQKQAKLQPLQARAEAAKASEKRKVLLEKINSGLQKLEIIREKKALQEKAEEAKAQIPSLEKSLAEIEERQDALRELYRGATERKRIETEIASIPKPQENLRKLEDVLLTKETRSQSLQSDIELFDQRADDLRETGKCDLCLRPFDSDMELQRAILEMENARREKEEELVSLEVEIAALRRDLPAAKKQKAEQDKLAGLQESLRGLEDSGDPEKIKKEGLELKEILEEARATLAENKLIAQSSAEAIDSEDLEKEIEELRRALPPESDEGEEVLLEVSALEQEIAFLQGQVPEIEKRISSLRAALQAKKRELSLKKKESEKLEKWNSRAKEYESLQTYLQAYQKHLAHEIRPALEEIGSEMIRRVSGGKHTAIRVDDNYEIEVEDREGRRLSSGMISGGEAVRANICLRLALTRLVSQRTGVPVAFLVFDEPLPAQDSGHIEKIIELLDSLRPFYQQQFIISHVGDLAVSREVDYVISFDDGPELLRA